MLISLINQLFTVVKERSILKSDALFLFITLMFYAVITLFGVIHHEPWRDEAEIWLYARDMSLSELWFNVAHIAGTPSLWYLINWFLFHLGFTYSSEFVVHWLIAMSSVVVFICYSPFSRLTKTLFVFSYFMLYEYVVVARNYSLTMLFLFLILSMYGRRRELPILFSILVFLLFNTNTHSFMAAVFFTAVFVIETWKLEKTPRHYIAYCILFLGISSFVLQVMPAMNAPIREILVTSKSGSGFKNILLSLNGSIFPYVGIELIGIASKTIIPVAILYVFFMYSLIGNIRAFAFVAITHSWLFYLFCNVNFGGARHHGLILVFLLAALWLGGYYRNNIIYEYLPNSKIRLSTAILNIFFAVTLISALNIYKDDYLYNFSGSKEAARFLLKSDLMNYTIVAYPPWTSCSILPYLSNMKFWYADREEYGSYLNQDKKYFSDNYLFTDGKLSIKITTSDVVKKAMATFPDNKNLLLILNEPLSVEFTNNFSLVFHNQIPTFYSGDETYYIYKKI